MIIICVLLVHVPTKKKSCITSIDNTTSNHDTSRCSVSWQTVPPPLLSKFSIVQDTSPAHVHALPRAIIAVALLVQYDTYVGDIGSTAPGHLDERLISIDPHKTDIPNSG